MKKRGFVFLFLVVIVVFLVGDIYASYQLGNITINKSYSIDKSYAPNGKISGWINISFNNEPVNSLFESSFNNEQAILIELINKTNGFQKTCTPVDCKITYSTTNAASSKTFNLVSGDKKTIGFKIDGKIVNINSISFDIESTATESCTSQLEIDFFKDNNIDFINYKAGGIGCLQLRNYGCYSSNPNLIIVSLDNSPKKHCQRIKLTKSPAFRIGAWVRKDSGMKNVTVALYDLSRDAITGANCRLPDASPSGGESSCIINFTNIQEKDYYVCIYTEPSGVGTYKIRGYADYQNGCAFYDNGNEIAAYEIFSEGTKFAPVGLVNVTNNLTNGDLLGALAKDYIWSRYGNLECSPSCVIPVEFSSTASQSITLKNLKIKYETDLGPGSETTSFYDLNEAPATLTTNNFQRLNLGDVFSVPLDYGNKTFELKFAGNKLFSEIIIVEKVPNIISLNKNRVAGGVPTEFVVLANSSEGNITKFIWEFGNGDRKETGINKVTYAYNATGNYAMKITAIDSKQLQSYKTFTINVVSPKEEANSSLEEMKKYLSNVKQNISSYTEFQQKGIKSVLRIDELNTNILDLEREYKQANSENGYIDIMKKIVALKIPELVTLNKKAENIPFLPIEDDINLDVLKTASGGDYTSEEEQPYKRAILAWNQENMNIKISYKEFSAKFKNENLPFIEFFDVTVNEKKDLSYNPYFIIKKTENLSFKENYLESEDRGYYYIILNDPRKTISFYTTEKIDFSNIPMFIAPEFSRLTISAGDISSGGENPFRWGIFILVIIILLIIGLISYIFLQRWYKYKYEKYLFSNANDLFNIISYINNAKKEEVKEKEIAARLKKAGWSSEQIAYALKKYAGRKTGMPFEIPLIKIATSKNPPSPTNQQNIGDIGGFGHKPGEVRGFLNK